MFELLNLKCIIMRVCLCIRALKKAELSLA